MTHNAKSRNQHRRVNVGIHPHANWNRDTWFQLHDRLQDLRVDTLGGLIRSHILPSQNLSDPHNAALKLAVAIRIRSHPGGLSHAQTRHIVLVYIHPHAKPRAVAQGHHRLTPCRHVLT
jgi:hypothetical protein